MIFQHTYQWIMSKSPHSGQYKTQTRRPYKPGDYRDDYKVISASGRTRWREGSYCAVQPGRGKKAVDHIWIERIRRERVCDISEADARAEGFRDAAHFMERWEAMHGSTKCDCWVIEFTPRFSPESVQL